LTSRPCAGILCRRVGGGPDVDEAKASFGLFMGKGCPSMAKKKAVLERRPFALIIRDGWGYNPDPNEDPYNCTKAGNTPVDRRIMAEYPHTLIHTYGRYVGLPEGTMGNSEVGHQNIGAGRIVPQETVRLTMAIEDGSFFENKEFLNLVRFVKEHNGRMHVMGLCSDAGVHALLEHLYGLLELGKRNGLSQVFIHAFTDGRDTPPDSSPRFIAQIEARAAETGIGRIATVMGRFYAMDRDSRWDRVQKAFECLRFGKGHKAKSAAEAIAASHANKVTDEFIEPTCIVSEEGEPVATIQDGDGVVFFNFRGDRPREITRVFVDPSFQEFPRPLKPDLYFVCMTEYDASIPAPVAFPKPAKMKNILGAYWGDLGLKQFRCAETEKYAHVTFFFNDYTEKPFKGEDRHPDVRPQARDVGSRGHGGGPGAPGLREIRRPGGELRQPGHGRPHGCAGRGPQGGGGRGRVCGPDPGQGPVTRGCSPGHGRPRELRADDRRHTGQAPYLAHDRRCAPGRGGRTVQGQPAP